MLCFLKINLEPFNNGTLALSSAEASFVLLWSQTGSSEAVKWDKRKRAGNAWKGKEGREVPALSLAPSFPARPPTPNRELLRRREWPLSTPPPKALAFDWKLFRNEKLHGTAYHKRCQRRIYKKFKHKQGTARLILRRTDKAGSQNCEQSGQLFRPYWDSSALCSEDM